MSQESLSTPLAQEVLSRFGGFYYISNLSSEVNGGNADTKGGTITIDTERLRLSNGGNISTSVLFGRGQGGNLVVRATDSIDITGVGPELLNGSAPSGLFAELQTGGIGSGGSIDVTTGRLNLSNDGEISAVTFNQGNAGTMLRDRGLISTTAGRSQAGGDGGNIDINARFIIAIPENTDISANAFTGTGGRVQINSQGIFGIESRPKLTEKSDITASSELGVSGTTTINTPDNSSIQNSFTGLSPNVIDTNALIANSCIVRSSKQNGTFFITGSGALRNSPGDGLVSVYSTGDVRSVEPTSQTWKKGDAIVEPQGLYRLADGRLVLSRECQNNL